MGAVWIGCGLAFTVLLRDLPEHGRLAAFTVLLAVWAGDTLAYVGGRLLGRHRMAPHVSPGKTWEGFAFWPWPLRSATCSSRCSNGTCR